MTSKELDKKFDANTEDILEHFDLDSASRRSTLNEQKRVNVDFPQWVVDELDKEAERIGVPRQTIIKTWIVDRLDKKKNV